MSIVSYLWIVSYLCCLFSYPNLLESHYRGRMSKSQTTREQAIEVGLSVREAEWRLDAELFLDEYPRWELGAPHWSVILHEMFLHAAKQGQKEAERFICWGHQGSLPRPDLEADQSAMKLMGYQTSHKEIPDIYHSVYLLKRSPGPLPCRLQKIREAIHDILFFLRSWLHWRVYPIAAKEDTWGPVDEPQSRSRRRGDSPEEALWEARTACQRALEATQVLKAILRDWARGWEMCNKPALITTVGVAHKVVLWTGDWGPLVGFDQRGGWPSRNQRLNQTPRRVGKVTPRAIHQGYGNLVGLAGLPTGYAMLVDGTYSHPRVEDPQKLTQ